MRARLQTAAIVVLVAGLALGCLVYFNADEDANATLDAMFQSKPYVRELQRFGGKASVVFDELMRWFDARWHGPALGVTIGWLSVLASAGLFFAASRAEAGKD